MYISSILLVWYFQVYQWSFQFQKSYFWKVVRRLAWKVKWGGFDFIWKVMSPDTTILQNWCFCWCISSTLRIINWIYIATRLCLCLASFISANTHFSGNQFSCILAVLNWMICFTRFDEDELCRFYVASNGEFSRFVASVKKTIRWRQTYTMLSPHELEEWSSFLFWHGYDVKRRPCLIIRLGLACSNLSSSNKPLFAKAVGEYSLSSTFE